MKEIKLNYKKNKYNKQSANSLCQLELNAPAPADRVAHVHCTHEVTTRVDLSQS